MTGMVLYLLYLKTFKTVFAPTWIELSRESQESWEALAKGVRLFHHDYSS